MSYKIKYCFYLLFLISSSSILCNHYIYAQENNSLSSSNSALPNFTNIIEKNSPAVVNISTSRINRQPSQLYNLPPELEGSPYGDLLRKFFDHQQEPYHHNDESLSLGSGTIISEDGYVVTNHHVVSNADKILVKLSDKRIFPAKLIGSDKGSDLALLKINTKDLPYVALGDSDNLKLGEWVLAIGSPFGYEYSSTAGIVSGKSRILGRERYVPFIQTDAAVNPGNSGGPLFNLKGEVIGINAQILSKSGGYLGLSFSIPSNVVRNVVTQLKEVGYVARGWLGIAFQQMDDDLAKSLGLDRLAGALVVSVIDDSPAYRTGIKSGDVILKFNEEEILDAAKLPALVGNLKPGSKVDLTVFRAKKKLDISMVVGKLSPDEVSKVNRQSEDSEENAKREFDRLGFKVRALKKDESKKLGVDKGGVIIDNIKEDSMASRLGFTESFVILSINLVTIDSIDKYNEIVNSLPPDEFAAIFAQSPSGEKKYVALKVTNQ